MMRDARWCHKVGVIELGTITEEGAEHDPPYGSYIESDLLAVAAIIFERNGELFNR